MTTTVQKLGNSFAFIITQEEARILGVTKGDQVNKKIVNNKIIIGKKVNSNSKLTLKDLLKNFDPKTLHDEVNWGYDIEAEKW